MEQVRLEMVYMSVDDLVKYERNTKTHPDTQIEKISRSIKNYGFDQPIAVDVDGVIIKGHGRLMAAKLLGFAEVPVIIRTDLTPMQAAASRIADNRVAESPWDENLLPMELEMLRDNDIDVLQDIGFDESEINKLLGNTNISDFDTEPKEYDESVAKSVKMKICPSCGIEFPL